jgi:hypothetical protein
LTERGTIPIVRRTLGEALKTRNGAVAQLGERRVRNAKVRGSIPLGSTKLGSSRQVLTVVLVPAGATDRRAFSRSKAVRRAAASASRR